ncbi:hypothetical protein BV22DRAFT_246311 [Leucogyrophana mollusca]|uniref:Uncharacterized protein n=1 Tax=Leucogyrophana mollusca TaxID=85980 RepID=A0ACB8BQU0_9AGAM|nr:hypothetical protein BV22DRAFT_246311 [Leucogyrophana mollusca]
MRRRRGGSEWDYEGRERNVRYSSERRREIVSSGKCCGLFRWPSARVGVVVVVLGSKAGYSSGHKSSQSLIAIFCCHATCHTHTSLFSLCSAATEAYNFRQTADTQPQQTQVLPVL